jgi:hypothetical protein
MQDQGRGWQPIAYASKVNSKAEANYSITELECLAVVWSVKLFRPYLYGRVFVIITDHSALKWLMTRPNLAGRLHRWSLTLQEYEFTIEYRPSATNVVADALSRAPAAVRAVVGERRRPGRRPVRTARPEMAAEAKTEDDEPMSTPAGRGSGMDEAVATALAALETTAAMERREQAVAAERLEAPAEGDGSAKGSAPLRVDRPLTRAAKRRMEEAATAALSAVSSPRQPERGRVADGYDEHARPWHLAEDAQAATSLSVAERTKGATNATTTTRRRQARVRGAARHLPLRRRA